MLKEVEDHWHTVEQKINFIFILSLEKKAIDLLTINEKEFMKEKEKKSKARK